MSARMSVRLSTHMFVHMRDRASVWMFVHMLCVCTHVHIHIRTNACMFTYVSILAQPGEQAHVGIAGRIPKSALPTVYPHRRCRQSAYIGIADSTSTSALPMACTHRVHRTSAPRYMKDHMHIGAHTARFIELRRCTPWCTQYRQEARCGLGVNLRTCIVHLSDL